MSRSSVDEERSGKLCGFVGFNCAINPTDHCDISARHFNEKERSFVIKLSKRFAKLPEKSELHRGFYVALSRRTGKR